jgi:hypothetical protein
MSRILWAFVVAVVPAVVSVAGGCGGGTSEAIRRGVGAECNGSAACSESNQVCLSQFKGGYCGASGCFHDTNCPQGSACVTEDDQINYCFLICADKPECNVSRTAANESNCTSSLTFVDGTMNRKVCRPPLSGTAPVDAATD